MAAVDLGDPLGDVVEEVPVVGDGEYGTVVLGQVLLKPEHALRVEVVGGLIQKQQVGLLQQQLGQGDTALLATREVGNGCVAGRGAQGIHGLFELGVEIPGVGGIDVFLERSHLGEEGIEVGVGLRHLEPDRGVPVDLGLDLGDTLLNVLEDGLRLVQFGLLHENADAEAGGQTGFPVGRSVETSHDLEDRRLTSTVRADHTDLRPRVERHGHVVEDELVADRFAGAHHGVNEFGHCSIVGSAGGLPVDRAGRSHKARAAAEKWRNDALIAHVGESPDEALPLDAHGHLNRVDCEVERGRVGRHLHVGLGEPSSHEVIHDCAAVGQTG